jgi:cobalt-zinc-cadmium efflux system outer membrane protein
MHTCFVESRPADRFDSPEARSGPVLRGRLSLAWLALAAISCTGSSIQSDVARVRDLSQPAVLADVQQRHVDPELERSLADLLAKPLDAEAAVRIALLANRELRANLRELGVTRGQLMQAGLLPNPRAEVELLPERSSDLELRLEYDISRALLAPLRASALSAELAAARLRVAGAVVELAARVRLGFFRVQAAEQRVAIGQDTLRGLAAAREATRALFKAGSTPELDLATQESAYEKGEVAVEQLELELSSERERFARTLGVSILAPSWQIREFMQPAPVSAPAPDQLEQRTLRANLALQSARQSLIALARAAGATRTEGLVPDVAVDVHALSGHTDADLSDARSWRFGAGVNLGLPLFDRQQGNVRSLEARFDAGLERYYGLSAELRSQAREALQRVRSAHTRALRYQQVILPGQLRVTRESLLQYNAMQLGIFSLLAARRDQLDTQLAYVDTLREYWSAVAELDALLHGARVAADGATMTSGTTTMPSAQAEHGS